MQDIQALKPRLDRDFAAELLKTFDDPQEHGVHLLFNQWWQYAPDDVIESYLSDFKKLPNQKAFLEEHYFSDTLDLDDLKELPRNTLGREYYHFIVDNGLEKNLAVNYKSLHDALAGKGSLDRMPPELHYAIIRGFQIHDLLHVLTGYEPTGFGEIALQAFCLAQIRFPYFGMWMSVTTTRMTLLDPDAIQPMMDAISEGWRYGRRAKNIQFAKWETMLERPLDEIRTQYQLNLREPIPAVA
ncbi:MAG: Coq4 family protein [Parvibaculaceae bacterium]|nr:Coq4 family protein [Parvibaculaceae bacterium]